jgi:hypothetical protein
MENFFEENHETICAIGQKHKADLGTALDMLVYDMVNHQRYTLGLVSRVKYEDMQMEYQITDVPELSRMRREYVKRHIK